MQRPALLVLAALLLAGALLIWLSFGGSRIPDAPAVGPDPGATAAAHGEVQRAEGAVDDQGHAARDLVASRPPQRQFKVHGSVLAERAGPGVVGARVLAYRGRASDSG
ncbi:MAG: hypothetical protein KDC48_09375, partial [Planctomycetes bacterium]|nr:hypothetical protein [Planctomycetota bacterium]